MRVMLTGDVVGRPGRRAFRKYTPKLREEKKSILSSSMEKIPREEKDLRANRWMNSIMPARTSSPPAIMSGIKKMFWNLSIRSRFSFVRPIIRKARRAKAGASTHPRPGISAYSICPAGRSCRIWTARFRRQRRFCGRFARNAMYCFWIFTRRLPQKRWPWAGIWMDASMASSGRTRIFRLRMPASFRAEPHTLQTLAWSGRGTRYSVSNRRSSSGSLQRPCPAGLIWKKTAPAFTLQ